MIMRMMRRAVEMEEQVVVVVVVVVLLLKIIIVDSTRCRAIGKENREFKTVVDSQQR